MNTPQHTFNGPLSGTARVSWYQKGKTPKVPHPQFFENPLSDFSQKLSGATRYLKCVNLDFGLDPTTENREKPYTVLGVFAFGGKTPPASRELDPSFS